MTPSLRCTDLAKRYPGQDGYALGDEDGGVSFEVPKGELFALLGPSGCGKTTTLRIVGGFVAASAGLVEIEGEDVTTQPPHQRPTNTVFQSYALFPHKNVADNVAFGLRIKRVPRAERERRVEQALEMVGLSGVARRRVDELSGGMAQRAALARAIVNQPAVLLLDEPLGALDLRLRRQMQQELVRLKRETSATFVHVTHDQEEACAIADRIAVMDSGQIVQVDTPVALYRRPRTAYVAEFLDAGTIVRGASTRNGDVLEVAHGDVVVRGAGDTLAGRNGAAPFAAVLPPDRVKLARTTSGDGPEGTSAAGTVEQMTFTGSAFECLISVSAELWVKASLTAAEVAELGGMLEHGERVTVSWRPEDVIFVEDTPSPDR
jgi:spermidine/putrescine transport system ATP-binding protein